MLQVENNLNENGLLMFALHYFDDLWVHGGVLEPILGEFYVVAVCFTSRNPET